MLPRYKLLFSKEVEKFLGKHPEVIQRFFAKLEILAINPFDARLDAKMLIGAPSNHRRLRIGKYRLLYEIQKDVILIYFYDADSRGDIY